MIPTPGADAPPTMFVPFRQVPIGGMVLIARTTADPLPLIPAIRDIIWEVDPSIALDEISTVEQAISASVASPRFHMVLVAVFAGLALALAVVGVYGVMSYTVGQQTREFGLRQALGARNSTIIGMVLSRGLRLAAVGVLVGSAAAIGLTRLVGSLLFDVSPTDPLTFGGVALVLLGTTAIACVIPARRAVAADPMDALKAD